MNVKPKKVVSLVLNSVMHDARVLKQAESLSNNGYDVTIIGVKDNKRSFDLKRLSENLSIQLVAWKSQQYKVASLLIAGFYGVFLCLSAIFLTLILTQISFESNVLNPSKLNLNWDFIAIIGTFVFVVFLVTIKALRVYRKINGNAVRYASLELGAKDDSSILKYIFDLLDSIISIRNNELFEAALKLSPDIVHCHDVHTINIGVRLKNKLGIKIIYDAHEIYEEIAQGSEKQKLENEKKQKIAEDNADYFITINESIANYYSNKYPRLPKATILKNACKFNGIIDYDGRLHEEANLPRDTKIILFQGGFAKARGLFDLIKIAKFLNDDWALVFMGWGNIEEELKEVGSSIENELINKRIDSDLLPYKEKYLGSVLNELETSIVNKDSKKDGHQPYTLGTYDSFTSNYHKTLSQLENLKSKKRIAFLPGVPQNELTKWTAGASLGVIPYENIGLNHFYCTPNKLWEYPNAGVPILASPYPEMQKIVEGHDVGWLIEEPISPRTLAEFIMEIDDEELRLKKENCYKFIESDNWSVYSERLIELYRNIK